MILNDRLVSFSQDKTIRICYLNSGECFKILRGHTKTNSCVLNSCVAVLSDEKIIGSSKFEIKICNVESKTCLRSFNVGFTNYIESFIQLSNVVSCSSDKTIKVWDIETSVCLNTLEYHDGGVYSET
jgi:WD40 repeat protein